MPVEYDALPFNQAINFFRQKVNLPTEAWDDIWQGMHSRAFVIAGATKQDLLSDFRSSLDKAISEGTTLATFQKDFDSIVKKHGWSYNGNRGWRSRVMYDTNIRQAYNAGREQQMQDPELRKARPYGLYRHGGSISPRPKHLAWNDKVLPLDDPWWQTHSPMNGWGCSCKKFMVSDRDLERRGLTVSKSPAVETYEWLNKKTGEILKVPKGIDPGFDYNIGEAAWGRQLSQNAMNHWKAQGRDAWKPLTFGGPDLYDRPAKIPLDKLTTKLGHRLHNQNEVITALHHQLGGEEKIFNVAGFPVLVNAESLGRHIDPNRAEFLPLIKQALNDPFEIWLSFEQHEGTGKVVMRQRIIKAFSIDGSKDKGAILIANASRGMLEAWTFIPVSRLSEIEKQRKGVLFYGR